MLGDLDDSDRRRQFELTLIDTPSLQFTDETTTQRLVVDILTLIDGRLADGLDEVCTLFEN